MMEIAWRDLVAFVPTADEVARFADQLAAAYNDPRNATLLGNTQLLSPAAQGQGLGTRFATMIHAFAFRHLALDRVYAAVVPENVASRRVFDKLGYVVDGDPAYGDPGDIVLRVDRAAFEERHAATLAEIHIAPR